ncbi:hypothetical protein B0T22DRAFT_218527 [Podospora appendiculata]|uniref:Uncharacterized protein n=1 Tax=Podospora appendiculata TaxID=314037 RepID=A0AAE0X537_9PEZI|nr:hypothetical protein B0T22DRAFT_218527 [Podospora appendiculata]
MASGMVNLDSDGGQPVSLPGRLEDYDVLSMTRCAEGVWWWVFLYTTGTGRHGLIGCICLFHSSRTYTDRFGGTTGARQNEGEETALGTMVGGRMRSHLHDVSFSMDSGFYLPGRMGGFVFGFRGTSSCPLDIYGSQGMRARRTEEFSCNLELIGSGKSNHLGSVSFLAVLFDLSLAYMCAYTPWSYLFPCPLSCLPWASHTHTTWQVSRPHGGLGDQWPSLGWFSDWERGRQDNKDR